MNVSLCIKHMYHYVSANRGCCRTIHPQCQVSFFNIFHPLDPVAYRLEPLLLPHLAHLAPAPVDGGDGGEGAAGDDRERMDWVLPSVAMSSAAQLLQVEAATGEVCARSS